MRFKTILAAAALALGASPALAADPATLTCVAQELSPQAREAYAVSARTLATDTVVPVSSDIRAAFDKALETCSKRHKWSAEATNAAKYIAMTDMALPELRKAAIAIGVDADGIARAVASLSPEHRARLASGDEAAVAGLMEAFQKHNVELGTDQQQTVLFALTVMLVRSEVERARFAAN